MTLAFSCPRLRAALVLAAVALGAADLRPQAVDYVGDLALPANHDLILPLSGRHAGQTGTRVMTATSLYRWNAATNALDTEVGHFPATFFLSSRPPTALAALGTPSDEGAPMLFAIGVRNLIFSYHTKDNTYTSAVLSVQQLGEAMLTYATGNTMAFSMSERGDRFFTVNRSNGVATDTAVGLVSHVGGSAFGPDGLLYVLDNPNGTYRVQSFDLSDGLADADRLRGSFTVTQSLTSSYAGMAIAADGLLYIADGGGGGVAYDLAGNSRGAFTFTGGGSPDTNGRNGLTGAAYLNADDAGNVFVYTPGTGLHRYYYPGTITDTGSGAIGAATLGTDAIHTVQGGGSLTLTGSASYGRVSVDVGTTLIVADTANLDLSRLVLTDGVQPGQVRLEGNASNRGVLSLATLMGLGLRFDGGVLRATDDLIVQTPVIGAGGAFVDTNSHTVRFHDTAPGAGDLEKRGEGTLMLINEHEATPYAGHATVSAGTLQIGGFHGIGGLIAGDVTVNGGTFALATNDASIRSLAGSGGAVKLNSYHLTVNQAADGAYAGAISGTGALTKDGTASLTLSGANTYTGATSVNAGTLVVNGALADTAVAVASGGTLGGTGAIGGLTEIESGAHLAPGNSPGTLTFTNGLTLNDGAALDFQLGTSSDLIRVTGGTLTGSASTGGITLNLSDAGGFAADTYVLFNFTGATTSSFDLSDFTLGNTIAGYDYALAFDGSALELTATASAVPEPSTYAAFLGGGALALAAWRRRQRVTQTA